MVELLVGTAVRHYELVKGVKTAPAWVLRNRHNKIAKGMTSTLYRCSQRPSDDACALSVKGTTDRLGSCAWMYFRKDQITKKYQLTEKGRERLSRKNRAIARKLEYDGLQRP